MAGEVVRLIVRLIILQNDFDFSKFSGIVLESLK